MRCWSDPLTDLDIRPAPRALRPARRRSCRGRFQPVRTPAASRCPAARSPCPLDSDPRSAESRATTGAQHWAPRLPRRRLRVCPHLSEGRESTNLNPNSRNSRSPGPRPARVLSVGSEPASGPPTCLSQRQLPAGPREIEDWQSASCPPPRLPRRPLPPPVGPRAAVVATGLATFQFLTFNFFTFPNEQSKWEFE